VATQRNRGAGAREAHGLGALRRQQQREPPVRSGAQPNEERLLDRLYGCDDSRAASADDADRTAATELAERPIDLERVCLTIDPDFGVGLAAVSLGHDC
jgi:hypothetical protein